MLDPSSSPPFLLDASVSPSMVNTDTIDVGPNRNPDDVLPITLLCTVTLDSLGGSTDVRMNYRVLNPDGSAVIGSGLLQDNGAPPDLAAQDNVYSGYAQFSILRATIGFLHIEFYATLQDEVPSNTIRHSVQIVRLNQPPVLSALSAPDSVALGTTDKIIRLEVDADDPDGLEDIRRVYFNSFLPGGTPAQGNPFQMYDDGTNGDVVPQDGTYTLLIALPPIADVGTYRFEFQAVDRANALSTVLIHTIEVTN